jgi:hypothetical protein
MGLKGHYHHHHPCLKAFCFILVLAAIAAGIFLLIVGALCFQPPYPQNYLSLRCPNLVITRKNQSFEGLLQVQLRKAL